MKLRTLGSATFKFVTVPIFHPQHNAIAKAGGVLDNLTTFGEPLKASSPEYS